MSQKRRKYTEEFKREAVNLSESLGNVSGAARQLGISDGLLFTWKQKLGRKVEESVGGNSDGKAALEIQRLRKENEELKKINLILKTAAAFFSQDHLK